VANFNVKPTRRGDKKIIHSIRTEVGNDIDTVVVEIGDMEIDKNVRSAATGQHVTFADAEDGCSVFTPAQLPLISESKNDIPTSAAGDYIVTFVLERSSRISTLHQR